MSKSIEPLNFTAQWSYLPAGNPPVTIPDDAISNCFPGLEYDFRNVWRNIFEGMTVHESFNYVLKSEDKQYDDVVGHRLLYLEEDPIYTDVTGPTMPGAAPAQLGTAYLEWSNALAAKLGCEDTVFQGYFTKDQSPSDPDKTIPINPPEGSKCSPQEWREKNFVIKPLKIRPLFAKVTSGENTGAKLPGISEEIAQPGDLTQSLCSPWQNDYRECACYYWAASRPDYVNSEVGADGLSQGQNWMQKNRSTTPKKYILDDRTDSRLFSYDDLFGAWQEHLKFQIGGKDYQ